MQTTKVLEVSESWKRWLAAHPEQAAVIRIMTVLRDMPLDELEATADLVEQRQAAKAAKETNHV
ncbi:MAG TPA: hypothetical protein VGR16_05285 [Thermomicrobiales bacterium]|nr:hypothetical protein [Thermomicrobiales bacterium]